MHFKIKNVFLYFLKILLLQIAIFSESETMLCLKCKKQFSLFSTCNKLQYDYFINRLNC